MNLLLREEVSVRTAVLQGHAVASGAHAASCYSQCAVVVCQSSVLYHRHVPQKGIGLSLCLDSSAKDIQRINTWLMCLKQSDTSLAEKTPFRKLEFFLT